MHRALVEVRHRHWGKPFFGCEVRCGRGLKKNADASLKESLDRDTSGTPVAAFVPKTLNSLALPRRRANGGTWLARRWTAAGRYVEHRIATSDDLQDADGVAVLNFGQAQHAAREWWRTELRREEGHDTRIAPLTVAEAVKDYQKGLERRGGKSVYHARRASETHILPALGSVQVAKLTAKRIQDWHHGLAERAPLARSGA